MASPLPNPLGKTEVAVELLLIPSVSSLSALCAGALFGSSSACVIGSGGYVSPNLCVASHWGVPYLLQLQLV